MTNIAPLLSINSLALLQRYTKLIVGYSGGLDSSVLLHLLASNSLLKDRLIAVHINHGLSPNALHWQEHCQKFCSNLNIPLTTHSVHFNRSANIEEEARAARYTVFSNLLDENDCLLLGHHLNDQAETVLLQLFRGAGVDGLAGMQEFSTLGKGTIARPFLTQSREQLEEYALANKLRWIEDESNEDLSYSRNYLRQQVMPLLTKKWPGVVGNLARTAIHCRQAKAALYELAMQDCPELEVATSSLGLESLKKLPEARIINVFRLWLRKNQLKQPSAAIFKRLVHELLWSSQDATPLISWGNISVRRYQDHIYLEQQQKINLLEEVEWSQFPNPCFLGDGLMKLSASQTKEGFKPVGDHPIKIKFRQGGERIVLHGQTKQLKKLFQEWGVPTWLRDRIPLLFVGEQLAVVVGYAVSDVFYVQSNEAWQIIMFPVDGH